MKSYGGIRLNDEQEANANIIISVGRAKGATDHDIMVALMTAMQESAFKNLHFGDRDSQGLFQQRPSQGWGTVAQVTNPQYAAGKFYDALLRLPNRDRTAPTVLAQKVQRSAYPNAYAKWEGMASAFMGTNGGGANGSTFGPMPSLLSGSGNVDPQAAIAEYGYIAQLANDVPDLKRVMEQAIANRWTPNGSQFTAAVQATAWYRNTAAQQRKIQQLKATQPGEYNRMRDKAIGDIWALGNNMGAKLDDQKVGRLVEAYLNLGWSDTELRRALAAEVQVGGAAGQPAGLAAATVTQLRDEASQYMVQVPDDVLQQWTRDILSGQQQGTAFHAFLVGQAKAQFPAMGDALDRGVTVRQYLDPYKQLAAQTLEVAPESVDLNDPKYRNPLITQDPTGQRGTIGLRDYETYLKNLPEYRKTRQANQGAATLTNTMLEMFGKVAR